MPHITVPDESTVTTYTVTSAQSVFSVPWTCFDKTDIQVLVGSSLLAQSAFSFVGNPGTEGGFDGATITLLSAVSNTTVTIYRDIIVQRTEDFGVGPVSSRDRNTALDRLTAMIQDTKRIAKGVPPASTLPESLRPTVPVPNYGTPGQAAIAGPLQASPLKTVGLTDRQISVTAAITSSVPVDVRGVGTGAGPGPAAQANSRVTQLVANGNFWAFEIDSIYPSYFDGLQFNQEPGARPQTSGGGIRIHTSATGGATNANTIIDRVSATNKNIGIEFHKPSYPQVRGFYADTWTTAALSYTTSSTSEGLGGLILHPYLFGTSGSTTQGGAILSSVGYTSAIAPMIIGGSYGVDWSVRDYPAGRFGVFNGSIENQGLAAIRARTVDGQPGSMFMVHGTEFSNVAFSAAMVADVLIEAYSGAWLDCVSLIGNVHRHQLVSGGFAHYDIRSGTGVVIKGAIINVIASSGGGTDWRAVKVGAQASKVYVDNPLIVGANPPAPYELTAQTTLFDVVNGITVAMLPNAKDGSIVWCSDAIPGTFPVITGGSGAMLVRQGGAWRPFTSTQAFRQNSATQNSLVVGNSDVSGIGSKLSFEQAAGSEVHAIASEYISTSWRYRVKGAAGILFELDSDGKPTFRPPASATPINNGDLVIQATSNTSLTFRFKGSDGTVRQASLTLA